MRKTRILSLLLAAIMTASSLPIVATSVSAAEPQKVQAGVELLAGTVANAGSWATGNDYLSVSVPDIKNTAAQTVTDNTYLRMDDVIKNGGAQYELVLNASSIPGGETVEGTYYGIKIGNTYTVDFYARTQDASRNSGLRWNDPNGTKVDREQWNTFGKTWKKYSFSFTANASSTTFKLVFWRHGNATSPMPIEIDDIKVTCGEQSYTYTFESGLASGEKWKCNGADAGKTATVVTETPFARVSGIDAKTSKADVVKAATEGLYDKAAQYNLGTSIVLTPGKYTLSFDARMSYYYSDTYHNRYEYEYEAGDGNIRKSTRDASKTVQESVLDSDGSRATSNNGANGGNYTNYSDHDGKWVYEPEVTNGNSDGSTPGTKQSNNPYHILYERTMNADGTKFQNGNGSYCTNYRDIEINLGVDKGAYTTTVETVTEDWSHREYTFTVTQNTTLSSISFGGTGHAYDIDPFDIANLSLKMVEPSYTVTNNAIESGLLVGATKNYTTVVDTKIDYTDVTTVPGDYAKNGFITVGERDWYWTNSSDGYISKFRIFDIKLEEDFEAGYTYYLKFDARHNVPTNDKQNLQLRINDSDKLWKTLADGTDGWNRNIQAALDVTASGGDVNVYVRRTHYERNIPVDIDNVVIWREPSTTKNGTFGPEDAANVLYNENFNNPDVNYIAASGTYGKIANVDNIPMFHNFDENYGKVNSGACALEYSNLNIDSGVYTLSADLRVPYYHFASISKKTYAAAQAPAEQIKLEQNDTAGMAAFKALNKHTAKIEFTLAPVAGGQSVTKTVEQEIDFLWNEISASIVVEEGYKLTGVKITPAFSEKVPDANKTLDFKNVSLVRHGGFVDLNTPIENPNGLLKDATKNYSDANVVGVEYDFEDYTSNNGNVAMNGYITAGRLPMYFRTTTATITRGDKTYSGVQGWASNQDYFTLKLDEDIVPGKAYAASVDVRKSVPDNQTDTKVNFLFEKCDPYRPGNYYFPNANEFTSFSRTTVAKSDASGKLIVSVRRGDNAINTPMDFDNLMVWEDTDKDGVLDSGERIIYSENFNDGNKQYIGNAERKLNTRLSNGGSFDLGTATLTHNFEETYAKVSGADCALTYSGLNGDSGVYTFTAKMQIPYHYYSDVRNEADWGTPGQVWAKGDGNGEAIFAASEHEVAVKFTLKPNDTNAAYEYKTVTTTVTNAWDDVTASVIIDEGYTLEAVTVTPTFKELAKTAWGADNVTLNFKNVNLTRLGGYVPFTGAIESGEFLTGADYNYTEVDTGYDFNTDNFEDGKAVKNGYISVGPMPWVYNGTKWVANDILLFKQNSPLLYTFGNRYAVSFSARKGVETDETIKLQAYFYGKNTGMPEITLTNEWQNYIGVWTNDVTDSAGQNINFTININGGKAVDTPVDLDNLVIWEDLNGNMILDDGETIAYSENYNTDGDYVGLSTVNSYICSKFYNKINDSWPTEANSVGASIIAKNERYYNNFTHRFEDNYAYGDLEYSNINDAGEGVYTFTAEIQLPYHYNNDMNSITSADPAVAQVYYDLNKHDVKVTFALSDGTSITEKSMTLKDAASSDWSSIAAAVVVNEGYTLTAVKAELISAVNPDTGVAVVPADKQVLSFRNAWLTSEALPIVEAEEGDDDNYLDQIKPTYNDNTIPSTVIEANPDGELYISERPNDGTKTQNFLVIKLDEALPAGEYKISYTIRAEEYVRIRTTINGATESEDTVDQHGNSTKTPSGYFIADGGDIATPCFINNNGVKWLWSGIEAGTEKTFVGKFTTTDKIKYPTITFNRSDVASDGKSALVIDNFRIWYEIAGGKEVNVCYETFDSEDLSIAISGNSAAGSDYTIEHMLPVSHIIYTPRDPEQTMSVNYDLDLTVDESVEGKYSFKAMVKLAEPTEKAAKARVYFNYSDGTHDVDYIDLTEDWSYIGRSDWLERNPKLESITIEFDSDVPVMLIKPELNIFYKYTYGKPNRGIVMVLLKKLEGKMIDPWKQVGVN